MNMSTHQKHIVLLGLLLTTSSATNKKLAGGFEEGQVVYSLAEDIVYGPSNGAVTNYEEWRLDIGATGKVKKNAEDGNLCVRFKTRYRSGPLEDWTTYTDSWTIAPEKLSKEKTVHGFTLGKKVYIKRGFTYATKNVCTLRTSDSSSPDSYEYGFGIERPQSMPPKMVKLEYDQKVQVMRKGSEEGTVTVKFGKWFEEGTVTVYCDVPARWMSKTPEIRGFVAGGKVRSLKHMTDGQNSVSKGTVGKVVGKAVKAGEDYIMVLFGNDDHPWYMHRFDIERVDSEKKDGNRKLRERLCKLSSPQNDQADEASFSVE